MSPTTPRVATLRTFACAATALAAVLSTMPQAQSQLFYVRPGATGANNGSDWTNAYATVPATLQRGATYYLADGSYGSQTFNDPPSGTALITIKKATATSHGTNTGWQSSYGDGAATFSNWNIAADYMVFDGQVGQWAPDLPNYMPHGFRVLNNSSSDNAKVIRIGTSSVTHTQITFKHVEAGFTNASNVLSEWGLGQDVVYSYAANVTCSYCWLHDAGRGIFMTLLDNPTIEYSVLERNGKSAMAGVRLTTGAAEHSEIAMFRTGVDNVTVRHSVIRDWRSTGGIILYDNNKNFRFYGNIVTSSGYYDLSTDSNGMLNGLGAGTGMEAYVYNNTFVDIPYGGLLLNMGSFAVRSIQNNMFYNVTRANGSGVGIGGSKSYNWYFNSGDQSETGIQLGSGDPFINRAGKDFRLAGPTNAGTTLTSPYNVDANGTIRGSDGRWDRGAFERSGSSTSTVQAPQNLRILQ